jgi:hypothetical protein
MRAAKPGPAMTTPTLEFDLKASIRNIPDYPSLDGQHRRHPVKRR